MYGGRRGRREERGMVAQFKSGRNSAKVYEKRKGGNSGSLRKRKKRKKKGRLLL